MYADIDYEAFPQENWWCEFYGNAKEPILANAPPPRGKPVEIRCFVDADHAGDILTGRVS
jgi:hypothetical protein